MRTRCCLAEKTEELWRQHVVHIVVYVMLLQLSKDVFHGSLCSLARSGFDTDRRYMTLAIAVAVAVAKDVLGDVEEVLAVLKGHSRTQIVRWHYGRQGTLASSSSRSSWSSHSRS